MTRAGDWQLPRQRSSLAAWRLLACFVPCLRRLAACSQLLHGRMRMRALPERKPTRVQVASGSRLWHAQLVGLQACKSGGGEG
jgi:hypothetical protein